jgi:hypothetical protein
MKNKKAMRLMEISCDVTIALGVVPSEYSNSHISFCRDDDYRTLAVIEFKDIDGGIRIFCSGDNVTRNQYLMLRGIASHYNVEFGEGYFDE